MNRGWVNYLHVKRNTAELRVYVEGALELQEIPIVHDHSEKSVLSRVTLDGVVEKDNLGQLDGDIVFRPSTCCQRFVVTETECRFKVKVQTLTFPL